jgi:hypothetical protein
MQPKIEFLSARHGRCRKINLPCLQLSRQDAMLFELRQGLKQQPHRIIRASATTGGD